MACNLAYINRKTQLRVYNPPEAHIHRPATYIAILKTSLDVVLLIYFILSHRVNSFFRQAIDYLGALPGKFDTVGDEVVVLVGLIYIITGRRLLAVGQKVAVTIITNWKLMPVRVINTDTPTQAL